MNLLVLILVPLITALAVLMMRKNHLVRWTAFIGSGIQLALSLVLYSMYNQARAHGETAQMLFEQKTDLFKSWHISFHLGVDGISVAMILLTSFVVVAGVLMSWKVEKMTKEFFFLLILLSLGAYGFFISLDLFILFFF
ncbi:NAD(P)H-quinone oxidoreductase chain 4, chloroplastic [Filimonas sp.]|nr:NAD(P)H-quinone oxidoreductase chain 4, chloroplastic [Filimonas sp.]